MDLIWKYTALVLVAVIMCITIGKTEKDLSLLLSMIVCCVVAAGALAYLEPVLELVQDISVFSNTASDVLPILLKAVGITLVAELAGVVCSDAGNAALGKTLQFAATWAILYLSVPVFQKLLTMVQEILGQL